MKFLRILLFRPLFWLFVRIILPILFSFILVAAYLLKPFWSKANYLRWLVLGSVGMRKIRTGKIKTARRYADELLRVARDHQDDPDYGTACHYGNLIFGRIALREGDKPAARQHLRDAGKTPGSAELDSFGPNIKPAKELLEAGEKEVVLEYFELRGNFWKSDYGRLGNWSDSVQKGKIPNFGPNLLY